MAMSNIANILFRIVCTIGLVIHLTLITRQYLSYEMTTSAYQEFMTYVDDRALSVCFRYIDLLDLAWIERKYGRNVKQSIASGTYHAIIKQNITLDELLKNTPSVIEASYWADLRDNDTYETTSFKDPRTVQIGFEIHRFTTQEYICFRIRSRTRLTFEYELLAKSDHIGMMFAFAFPPKFSNTDLFFNPVVHGSEDYPFRSFMYSPPVRHSPKLAYNVYRVFSQRVVTDYLPHPYSTNCRDYGSFSRDLRMSNCLIQSIINQLGVIPYSELVVAEDYREYGHLKIKQPSEVAQNRTLRSAIKKIRNECVDTNRQVQCRTSFHITFVSVEIWVRQGLIFRVGQPTNPTVHSVYQPTQDVYTFALLTFSCFGVWIGWSMIDFNPTKLINIFNRRNQVGNREQTRPNILRIRCQCYNREPVRINNLTRRIISRV